MEPIERLDEDSATPRQWAASYECPRDWVRANMVSSADGAATIAGRVGDLTGSVDQQVLTTLRMMADVVLVGAGTVRAEGYGPIEVDDDWARYRRAEGLDPVPPLAVVSNSGDLDTSAPLFSEAEVGPILVVPENCPRLEELRAHGEVVIAGRDTVDLTAALAALRERGLRRVLCEGGPTLLGDLITAGLLDELCLAISPTLVGETSQIAPRPSDALTRGVGSPVPVSLVLTAARQAGDYLFLRYGLGH